MEKRSDSLCQSKPTWKRHPVLIIVIVLVVAAAGAMLYAGYATRSIRRWNEEQRRNAIEQLKNKAGCPPEMFQLSAEEPFLDLKDAPETIINDKSPKSWWHYFEGKKKGHAVLKGRSIRLRSDDYLNIINNRPLKHAHGIVMKVSVSGRGRICPYISCQSDKNILGGDRNRIISTAAYRVSSLWMKDYFFPLPKDPVHDFFYAGIRIRGNLNIAQIAIFTGTDRREQNIATVSARILETSEVPNPEKSSYPDCNCALKMKTLQIEKGKNIPQEFVLLAPAFRNRKKTPESQWKKDDIIRLSMIRFQEEREAVRQIQQADTIEDFDSERFSLVYSVQPRKILLLKSGVRVNPSFRKREKYISGYDRPQNPALTPRETTARNRRITVQREKIKKILETMKQTPDELNREYERIWEKNRKRHHLFGKDLYWVKQGNSCFVYQHRPSSFYWTGDISQTILSIKALSDYLLVHGIAMIVVICPYSNDISARIMNPELAGMPDWNAANIARQLLEQKVEALYISDEVAAHARDYDLMFCYPEEHPAYGTQQIAAGMIARYLQKEFPEICRPKYRPDELTRKWIPYPGIEEILQENWKLWDICFGKKIPLYQHVMLNGKTIPSDPASPIILYGNSYLHTPEALPGIYLASLLTDKLKMGFTVMFRIATQPLTSMSLELLQEPEKYLKGKKVCIFYYGTTHFRQTRIWNIRELDQIKRQNSAFR